MKSRCSAIIARLLSITLVGLAFASAVPSAHADGSSIVTLGAGSGVGRRADTNGGSAFVNQANVRLKLLHVIGLDYSFDLAHDPALKRPDEGLQYRAKMRLSALLYPYSDDNVAFYIGGGIGGTRLAELASVDKPGNSYHAGIGFEIHAFSHVSFDLSFMMVVPGVDSIERSTTAEISAAWTRGGAEALAKYDPPGVDEFISLKNHELMIRMFIFL